MRNTSADMGTDKLLLDVQLIKYFKLNAVIVVSVGPTSDAVPFVIRLPYAYDVIKIDKLAGSCTYHSASWMSHDYTLDSHVPDYGDPPMTFETKGGTDVISFAVQVQVGPGICDYFYFICLPG